MRPRLEKDVVRVITGDATGDDGPSRPLDDVAILRRTQRDLREFAPLYERYFQAVFAYCYRRLGEREAAADAAGQVFAKALASIQGFHGGAVGSWLFTIARHVVIDLIRTQRPHLDVADTPGLPDPGPLPDEHIIASERTDRLLAAIERLTPEQRAIMELRWVGFTGPEIAAALGLSLRAVKSGQYRAYVRLRGLLSREHFFEDAS